MSKLVIALLLLATTSTVYASPAVSPSVPQLASASGCVSCHKVDKKVIGPSFQDISRKYGKDTEAKALAAMRSGSKGTWGPIPMPPARVSDADVKSLAAWIASLR